MSKEIQVVMALNGADKETRYSISTAINKYCNNNCIRVSLVDVLEAIVRDPGIFNVPNTLLTMSNRNKEMQQPIIIKDAHLRRIIGRMYEMLADKYAFNPVKIGLNNFRPAILKTPSDLLNYVGMEIIRKVYPDFLPLVTYSRFLGQTGSFVIDDIKFHNELQQAHDKFQLVYFINVIKDKKIKPKQDEYSGVREVFLENEFYDSIKFDKDSEKLFTSVSELCKKIEIDVGEKVSSNSVKPLLVPFNSKMAPANDAAANHKIKAGELQVGKAVFVKGDPMQVKPWSDDDIVL